MSNLHEDQEITQITDTLSITSIAGVRRNSTQHFDKVLTVCQESVEDNVSVNYNDYCMSDGDDDYETGECSFGIFERAANELYVDLSSNTKTLIHCHRGRSRSVSVAAAALGRLEEITDPDDALTQIEQHRTRADPNEQLRGYINQYIDKYTE